MKPKADRDPESVVREIKRKSRREFNPEERIRIILEGLKGEDSIAAICRRDPGINDGNRCRDHSTTGQGKISKKLFSLTISHSAYKFNSQTV